jgi:hypothetical protein
LCLDEIFDGRPATTGADNLNYLNHVWDFLPHKSHTFFVDLSNFDKSRFVKENKIYEEYLKTEPKTRPRNGDRISEFKDPEAVKARWLERRARWTE